MKLTLKNILIYSMLTFAVCLVLSEDYISADEKTGSENTAVGSESSITVNNCRIKLIDRVILGSDRPGVLEFVEPNEGELVKKGQEIAALKSDTLQAAKATAKKKATNDIEIRYSQKARDTAYVELEMNLDINKRVPNTISKLDIKRLTLNAEKSDLQIEQAELEFEMNKLPPEL